jgi:hypothetical protein
VPTSYSAFHRKAEELSLRAYLRKYAENKDLDLWKWEEVLAAWRVEASRNVMEELRQEVYTLNKPQPLAKVENKVKAAPPQRQEEIVKHMFDHIVAREISRFVPIYDQDPANRDHGLALYVEKGGLSPILMHEIGVYREETFRRENEGTGRSIDFQELDRDYYQFIIWDKAKKQIVGGQRIGVISELVPSYSLDPSMRGVGPTQKRGVFPKLYTSESIDYSSLIYGEYFSFGAEISRTFIRPEYQNEPFPLAVMWSGLGQFLVRNSNIRYLLGTVSISGNLHPDSVRVIIGYTLKNHSSEKGKIVFPRKPVRIRGERSEEQIQEIIGRIKNAKGLEQEISTIEGSNGVKLNPLIKAYIAKGAKFLVWNHDAEFNTFDALIEDDLPHQPLRALKGYLGVDGAMSYLRDNGVAAE